MAATAEEQAVTGVYPVRGQADVVVARRAAQRIGERAGLSTRRATEIAIVVSELASNIVKYGVRGEVALYWEKSGEKSGEPSGEASALVVVAKDVGPRIHDLEIALEDGCDDRGPIDPAELAHRGGLGTGLGAVVRLADRFECRQDDGGKEITVRFFR